MSKNESCIGKVAWERGPTMTFNRNLKH